jgi:hypothetical protein
MKQQKKTIDGLELHGRNIKDIQNISIEGCHQACVDDVTCVGFTFDTTINQCSLKDFPYGPRPSEGKKFFLFDSRMTKLSGKIPGPRLSECPFKTYDQKDNSYKTLNDKCLNDMKCLAIKRKNNKIISDYNDYINNEYDRRLQV